MIKKIIKRIILFLIMVLIDFPLYLVYKIIFFSTRHAFNTSSQLLSLIPGLLGNFIRQGFYKLTTLRIDNDIWISFGTVFSHPEIKIYNNAYIGQNCSISKCTIFEGAHIGDNVDIISGRKTHGFTKDGKIFDLNLKNFKIVHIGKNTWIGNSSVIMADIGESCIIGAGSVVVKPIPDWSVAVGNPAKVIKKTSEYDMNS
jgi:acetyltransferase-like isoleucine patch superfamily enzyme